MRQIGSMTDRTVIFQKWIKIFQQLHALKEVPLIMTGGFLLIMATEWYSLFSKETCYS